MYAQLLLYTAYRRRCYMVFHRKLKAKVNEGSSAEESAALQPIW